ncbi:MAG: hypothetical protein HRF50_04435 [Phycisphaerae bacterium]|jgi:hypothetical protein
MTTYPTLDEARRAATSETFEIVEIDHARDGRCYVCCRSSAQGLRAALARAPVVEIVRVIGGHTIKTAEQIEAERVAYLREHCTCERCGVHIDGNVAYRQEEWGRLGGRAVPVTAYYCDPCRVLLQAVGQGEYTAMHERAVDVPSVEPYTKE